MNRRTAFDDAPTEVIPAAIHVAVGDITDGTVELSMKVVGTTGVGIVRERMVLRPGETVVLKHATIRLEIEE